VHEISSRPVIRSLLTSLGQLRYRHEATLDALSAWLVENRNDVQRKDLVVFLLATATLNYIPKNSDLLFEVDVLYNFSLAILSNSFFVHLP
jgi:hypothetical protein